MMRNRSVVFMFIGMIIALTSCNEGDVTYIFNDMVSQYELNRSIVQVNTTNVATGFETVFSDLIADSADRAQFCQAFIEPVRYFDDESGYFFVESNNAWMVAHATKPELIGTYRMDVTDANGKEYVKEMVNTILYIGYGFVEYYFQNPVSGINERKLAFVKSMPAAEFWMGSGFYGFADETYYSREDANKQIVIETTNSFAEGMGGAFNTYFTDSLERVEFCRVLIDHVRFFDNQSGYFFMYDFNCVNVAHGTQKYLQGENLYDYQDSHGNYVIRDLVAVARDYDEGYYEYYWNNPVTGNEEPKLAWVKKVPGIDYFIGSGIYLEEY
jgi:signal transduction histidine kinase